MPVRESMARRSFGLSLYFGQSLQRPHPLLNGNAESRESFNVHTPRLRNSFDLLKTPQCCTCHWSQQTIDVAVVESATHQCRLGPDNHDRQFLRRRFGNRPLDPRSAVRNHGWGRCRRCPSYAAAARTMTSMAPVGAMAPVRSIAIFGRRIQCIRQINRPPFGVLRRFEACADCGSGIGTQHHRAHSADCQRRPTEKSPNLIAPRHGHCLP